MKFIVKKFTFVVFVLILLMFPSMVQAHLIGGNGIFAGLAHPFSGLDHLIVMVAVGIISVRLGEKNHWKMLPTFLFGMISGGLLGMIGGRMSFAEVGIVVSVFLSGILIVFLKRVPNLWVIFSVAVFSIFHGHVHATEMPLMANPLLYAIGFIVSTAVLLMIGRIISFQITRTLFSLRLFHSIGFGVAMVGFFFFFKLIFPIL